MLAERHLGAELQEHGEVRVFVLSLHKYSWDVDHVSTLSMCVFFQLFYKLFLVVLMFNLNRCLFIDSSIP